MEILSFTYLSYLPIFIALYITTKLLLHRIRNLPPGPFICLPVLGHLNLLKPPIHKTLSNLSAQYGPVMLLRLGTRPALVVSSASAVEECFTKNDVVFANRPRLIAGKHLGYNYTSLAWAPYGERWRDLRRISTVELLSSHCLGLLSGIRADEVRLLVDRVRRSVNDDPDRTIELRSMLSELALNIMMRMMAGKRYYGEESDDWDEAKRFREMVEETFKLYAGSNFADFLPAPAKWFGVGRAAEEKMINLQEKRDSLMQVLIDEHRGFVTAGYENSEKKTMLDVLLKLQETDPESFKDEDIRSLFLVLLAAGTDTSARTIESSLSLMLSNPRVLEKAQAEIDSLVGKARPLEESDLNNLPYLRCILQETLRMCPAAPILTPHESSAECVVGGYKVPRGTMLFVNVWAIQNDPKNWAEPEKFKPERFEGGRGEIGLKWLPFGSGRRACPGDGLALKVAGLVVGSLLQRFDWERVGEDNLEGVADGGMMKPLKVKCKSREQALQPLLDDRPPQVTN